MHHEDAVHGEGDRGKGFVGDEIAGGTLINDYSRRNEE